MKKKICIMLCGKTGSGKSEVCNMLINKYNFKRYSFGDPIRDLMRIALPNIDYHTNVEARKVIIDIAEAPKRIAPKCWAYVVSEKILIDTCPNLIVIDDLRFGVELNHIKEVISSEDCDGGYKIYIVKIVNDEDNYYKNNSQLYKDKEELLKDISVHKSNVEHETFFIDHTIQNDGNLQDLNTKVKKFLNKIL